MINRIIKYPRKRKQFAVLAILLWTFGWSDVMQAHAADDPQKRFNRMGAVLVVDAVTGAELQHVKIYDDRGIEIYSSGVVSRQVRKITTLSGTYIPLTIRVIWRKGAGWDQVRKISDEGIIEGDYTITVAERIPDQVLNDIHQHGGNLRLKFRLKPDGVLFGWDIERAAPLGDVSIYETPGGDFLETRY